MRKGQSPFIWTEFRQAELRRLTAAGYTALDDSGLGNLFTDQQQEAICDAIATARMRERFG